MSDSSVLVLEPAAGAATAEIDAEQISASGPQASKPLRRQRLQLAGKLLAQIMEVLNTDPAGTEYAALVRPIFPASGVNISDRDARLLGRGKLLDSLGNVIDPALKGQLPAALVSGRLDVNVGASAAIDVSDRDARLAGRVKLLDSLGSVIDPALKSQLPAALVGGRVDVNLGASVALDVSDRDARLAGRAKILDSLGNVIDPALKSQLPAALASDVPLVGDSGLIARVLDTDRFGTGSLGALNAAVTIDCQGKIGAGFTIAATTLVGTIVAEWSPSVAGSDWFNTSILNHASLLYSPSGLVNPVANSDYSVLLVSAARRLRIKCSSYGSGAAPVTVVASNVISPLVLAPALAINGSSSPLFHVATSGVDGAGVARALLLKNADPSAADYGQVMRLVGTIIPGTSATALGKAEDAVVGDGDVGVGALVERFDAPVTAKTSADRDYVLPSADRAGVLWVRKRQLITYTAVYRLIDSTAGQLSLTFTFVANTNKQLGTIYHTGASTKTVRIREAGLWVALGAAGTYNLEFRPLSATTAPATGNPAITPTPHNQVSAAAEATCLALPTTAGSLVNADRPLGLPVEWLSGAGAGPTNPAALAGQYLQLYKYEDSSEEEPYVMRAGVAEGYAINGRCTAAVAGRFVLLIKFTEEA